MAAELTAAVERGLYLVRPLGGAALRTAIVEPARRAGLRIEPGLVDLVLHDVEDQPAALPLLSHALVETWQRREGATLTVEGYEQSGGLSGAVSRSAERLFESLPAHDRALCRSLMLRLVLRPMDGSILARHVPVTALPPTTTPRGCWASSSSHGWSPAATTASASRTSRSPAVGRGCRRGWTRTPRACG